MGVYIKSLKMPDSCAMCPLCHRSFDGNETRLACYGIKKWCDENVDRLNDCPLVEVQEPHGRLIDADEVLKEHCTESCRKKPSCEENCIIYDMLHFAKTVIEAEEEA